MILTTSLFVASTFYHFLTRNEKNEKKIPKIIIAGPPGSGKGTQCEFITKEFGCVHISTGDLIRATVKEGGQVAETIKSYMGSGKLVPEEIVNPLLKGRLEKEDVTKQGWLLDGYPRSDANFDYLTREKITPNIVLLIEVSDDIALKRQTGRVTAEDGKVYNLFFSPPPNGMKYTQRATDADESKAKKRMEVHHEEMKNFNKWYPDTITFDGTKDVESVKNDIIQAIKKVL